jgi:hypothetical protein
MLSNKLLRGGLTAFFFQYLLQAGLFFVIPLFLSVALGLSAIDTGLRIRPLDRAAQLGSITVSAVPDERSAEVGGPQNTVMFLGSSIGTALIGAVLISALGSSFFTGIAANPQVPQSVSAQSQVKLAGGVPFVPDDQLSRALAEAGVTGTTAVAVMQENEAARLAGLRSALITLALLPLIALFFSGGVPSHQPGTAMPSEEPVSGRAP